MLPTYGSLTGQASTFIIAPAIGKKDALEIAGLPRSSSSDSSCARLVGPVGARMRGGTADVFVVGEFVKPGIKLVPDLEGGTTLSLGTGGFEVAPLESELKEDDTLRKAKTFFPKEPKMPDDVGP